MEIEIIINFNWLFGFATVVYKDKYIHINAGLNFDKELEKAKQAKE